jgi:hypothetical protein
LASIHSFFRGPFNVQMLHIPAICREQPAEIKARVTVSFGTNGPRPVPGLGRDVQVPMGHSLCSGKSMYWVDFYIVDEQVSYIRRGAQALGAPPLREHRHYSATTIHPTDRRYPRGPLPSAAHLSNWSLLE